MDSSSTPAPRLAPTSPRPRHGRAASLMALALSLWGAGCAHMPQTPPPSGVEPRAAATAPAAPKPPREAPGAATSPRRDGTDAAARSDPSEVMSAEELASIPEPIPGDPSSAPTSPQGADAGAREPRSPATGGMNEGQAIWRVQVLATPDRDLADRVGLEAAEKLGTTAKVEFENSLYKVRLGRFASEGDAEGLRNRALEQGYSGAFRVKERRAATDE